MSVQQIGGRQVIPPFSAQENQSNTSTTGPEALAYALDREHAAVFLYGAIAAFIRNDQRNSVSLALAAHRSRRDAIVDLIAESNHPPVVPAPAYHTSFPVNSDASALDAALVVETDCAAAWRAVVERTAVREVRATAVDALSDASVRATRWRLVLDQSPATEAFPGT
ncbi:ferritin-like domain-containing protein [Hoyosella rhizosphaerae]|uniref:DUF4439 domain-containing protein n=1 Tax=Hoyosella rhizosphaerae TaxID=1755582 RepID=A0A916U4N8_9ACTN|nr:ferritin-like domain-containing protein [Hoyosella rhizosphaerae]MBN4926288.1 ferritin-like domain-containing protein [Hoyosella rhizosphaerae]GGC60539.1 hypothetical protein GCM10011410_11320 [Hoyosella rhizosphaerae]